MVGIPSTTVWELFLTDPPVPVHPQFGDVHIYRTTFRGMKHTLTKREEKTLMKLIVHPETDKVTTSQAPVSCLPCSWRGRRAHLAKCQC